MLRLTAITMLVLLGALAPSASAQTCPEPMPLEEVAAAAQAPGGFTVSGLTVSRGTEPDPFEARVLGVLNDGVAPGVDMIIVEITESDAVDRARGIWAGMSGSPVYADDGRLVGAVAYGLSFGPSKLGGLAAADDMLRLLAYSDDPAPLRESAALPSGLRRKAGVAAGARMSRLPLPLGVSGLGAGRAGTLLERLGAAGVTPYSAGAAAAAAADPSEIQPGGNFAAAISYGYLSAVGVGTTTFVCDGRAVAFGHPMLFDGPTSLSAHTANAITVQDDPTLVPFKLANPGGIVGTLDQDRLSGISALLGATPRAVEVTSKVNAQPPGEALETFVNRTRDTPNIAAAHLLGAIDGGIDRIGAGTSELSWTATLRAGAKRYVVDRTNRFADTGDISFVSTFELFDQLFTLTENPFEEVTLERVDMTATVDHALRQYLITGLQHRVGSRWVAVDPERPVSVKPGSALTVRALLAGYRSAGTVAPVVLTFAIPANAAGASGTLDVTGGPGGGEEGGELAAAAAAEDGEPKSLAELVSAIETAPRNDELTARLGLFGEGPEGVSESTAERSVALPEVVSGFASAFINVEGGSGPEEPPEEPQPAPQLDLRGAATGKLGAALARGIRLTVRAGAPGRLVVRALVSKRAARRLGVKRAVGKLSRRVKAGRTVVRLQLSPKARRRLKGAKAVKLTLRAQLTDREGNRRADRLTVRLTRRAG